VRSLESARSSHAKAQRRQAKLRQEAVFAKLPAKKFKTQILHFELSSLSAVIPHANNPPPNPGLTFGLLVNTLGFPEGYLIHEHTPTHRPGNFPPG
jgi:hypothetical protein